MHAASVSVNSYGLCSCCLVGLVFLVSSIPSDSYTLPASSSMRFPEFWGEGFDGDLPFRTERSKVSHSLCNVCLWGREVSIFVPSATTGSVSDRGWIRCCFCGYSRILWNVILSLHFFFKTSIIFYSRSLLFSLRFLVTQEVSGMGFISDSGPYVKSVICLVTPTPPLP